MVEPGNENVPPAQDSAGCCDANRSLGTNVSIKTEQVEALNSPSDHCANQNDSAGQWTGPEDVVSKSLDPLTEIGTKRRRVEGQFGFSKIKSVSLAPPTMCAQVMVKKIV